MDHINNKVPAEHSGQLSSTPVSKLKSRPLWAVGLFYFVTVSALALAFHSITRLRAVGQPIAAMLTDDLSIAALFAIAMTVREWVDR